MKNINISKNSQYNYVCITYVELYILENMYPIYQPFPNSFIKIKL